MKLYAKYYRIAGEAFHRRLANGCRASADFLSEMAEVYDNAADMFGCIADHAEKHGLIATFSKRVEILSGLLSEVLKERRGS